MKLAKIARAVALLADVCDNTDLKAELFMLAEAGLGYAGDEECKKKTRPYNAAAFVTCEEVYNAIRKHRGWSFSEFLDIKCKTPDFTNPRVFLTYCLRRHYSFTQAVAGAVLLSDSSLAKYRLRIAEERIQQKDRYMIETLDAFDGQRAEIDKAIRSRLGCNIISQG